MKNSSTRTVEPELLDELPPQDRRARRSRLDLRRLNQWMNHPQLMARILSENLNGAAVRRLVELGAGDGHFLLSVARHLHGQWPEADVTLVDRQDAFDAAIRTGLRDVGWRVRTEITTASEWLRQSPPNAVDTVVANLFLHHFQARELEEMFSLAARVARAFVALEPRRSRLPRLFGRLLWVIRCNSVTRHDARVSIRAGFSGHELSAFWPDKENWELAECPAGWFSHLFIARKKD